MQRPPNGARAVALELTERGSGLALLQDPFRNERPLFLAEISGVGRGKRGKTDCTSISIRIYFTCPKRLQVRRNLWVYVHGPVVFRRITFVHLVQYPLLFRRIHHRPSELSSNLFGPIFSI